MTSQALNSEGVRLYQTGNYQQAAEQFQRFASRPAPFDAMRETLRRGISALGQL